MPIYEYQCDSCSHHFEVKQGIKDEPLRTCERCGQPVRRLISSPGIMFKGSGWYITDYSNKLKPKTEAEKPAGEKKDAAAGSTSTPSAESPPPAASGTSSGPSTPSAGSTSTPSSSKKG